MKTPAFKPSTDLKKMVEQLEAFCESRNRKELHKGIRYLSANFPKTPRVLNRCLDWYWRTGMLTEGLRLAAPSFEEITKRKNADSIHTLGTERALFYLVFLANLSGLPWVRRWLSKEEHHLARSPKDHLVISNLWTAAGDFQKAFLSLERYQAAMKQTSDADQIALSRMIPMSLGYIHYQTGDYTRAKLSFEDALQKIDTEDSPLTALDALLMKLLCQARTLPFNAKQELLEIQARFDSALAEFPHLQEFAPRLHVAFLTRKAVLLAQLQNKEAARKLIQEADRIQTVGLPDYSPYRRVNLLREFASFDVLSPEQWETLIEYPDSPQLPQPHLQLTETTNPLRQKDPYQISQNLPEGGIRISVTAGEYQLAPHHLHFGIPKEIELLALLRRAHPLGLHRNLAMALLWPDQGTLIRELESRLAQLTQRLRKLHGFEVQVNRECLSLLDTDAQRIYVDRTSQRPLALQLSPPSPLSTEWIAQTYQLGLTQARKVLQSWIERGWVKAHGKGARTQYQLIHEIRAPLKPE
jgi:tetratricopeptide (TPR) repeat protein